MEIIFFENPVYLLRDSWDSIGNFLLVGSLKKYLHFEFRLENVKILPAKNYRDFIDFLDVFEYLFLDFN